ncbi:hypothetical protein CDD80_6876 [Ophiocordyceps camponoti-rufipedis]|uniref:Uncharacterized protein n=1 Tax=Ophiocordyceps camponoti-rufipedis TaxID=2004952 RepID=A0A2C5YNP6_9HYPO|nr:hypothetical protein CDD80_6876 [Ophiocordyceps camponoti-rufipedis]
MRIPDSASLTDLCVPGPASHRDWPVLATPSLQEAIRTVCDNAREAGPRGSHLEQACDCAERSRRSGFFRYKACRKNHCYQQLEDNVVGGMDDFCDVVGRKGVEEAKKKALRLAANKPGDEEWKAKTYNCKGHSAVIEACVCVIAQDVGEWVSSAAVQV